MNRLFRLCVVAAAAAGSPPAASADPNPPKKMAPADTATVVLPAPAPLADDCLPPVEPCPAVCPPAKAGPRIRVVVPPPVVTYTKCPTKKVVEAGSAAESCRTCPPPCPPAMRTILVPYTYYVNVPTYGVVPTPGYGAAPVGGYGALPPYGAVPPPGYGAPPAPLGYGAPPPAPGYGAPPAEDAAFRAALAALAAKPEKKADACPDECKKLIADVREQVDKLNADLTEFKKSSAGTNLVLLAGIKDVVAKLNKHTDELAALSDVKDKTVAARLRELDQKIINDVKALRESLKKDSFKE